MSPPPTLILVPPLLGPNKLYRDRLKRGIRLLTDSTSAYVLYNNYVVLYNKCCLFSLFCLLSGCGKQIAIVSATVNSLLAMTHKL